MNCSLSARSNGTFFYKDLFSICEIVLLFVVCVLQIHIFFRDLFNNYQHHINISFNKIRNELKIWFNKPSSEIPYKKIKNRKFNSNRLRNNLIWQQNTIPIGNSYLGANIFGEISTERVTFNEKTLWEGGPSKKRPNYIGGNLKSAGQNGKLFREIQKLFSEGKDKEAGEKCQSLIGEFPGESLGSFQCFGELQFDFLNEHKEKVSNYVRYLDLNTGTARVTYRRASEKGDVLNVEREFFASYPEKVIVIKFTSSASMTIECRFIASHSAKTTVEANQITVEGELEDNEMKFNGKLHVTSKDGKVKSKVNSLLIEDATEVVFFAAAATDYNNSYPLYRTGETSSEVNKRVQEMIDKAVYKGYEKVKESHLTDYKSIFGRVKLYIGQISSQMPTDELLSIYKSHITKSSEKVSEGSSLHSQFRYLEILLFQYGRYLEISSSRAGTLPSNLQGVWNDQVTDVPWAADYHININLQMNYWPTFSTNMAECGTPLLDFIESIREPGRVAAFIYTGVNSTCENGGGFMTHHRLSPFGWTAPGQKFVYGWSPTSLLWILHNVFELFLYTNNVSLLRDRIYPLLREEAFYFEKLLVFDKRSNRTVTSPASSPEHGPPTNGNTFEQTNLWQHYTNMLTAARILGVDAKHHARWQNLIDSFKPIEIGLSGQIKEWYNEGRLFSMGEKNHRHLSHLLGLFPYNIIDETHKEWLDAAIVSLNSRGDQTTGWGMGQRINAWARVGDGDRAFKLIQYLLKNGIYSNLWDTHPPFQIDGNFGATSGMAEMLMQSTFNKIKILPAIPKAWMERGSFVGLVAKGNIVVSCWWEEGRATEIVIEPRFEADVEVACRGIDGDAVCVKEGGEMIGFRKVGKGKISIKVIANHTYLIKLNCK